MQLGKITVQEEQDFDVFCQICGKHADQVQQILDPDGASPLDACFNCLMREFDRPTNVPLVLVKK